MIINTQIKVAMSAAVALMGALTIAFAGTAQASVAKPELSIRSIYPDSVQAGEKIFTPVFIINTGDAASHGPIKFVYTAPGGAPATFGFKHLWSSPKVRKK